jgi:hypothetical protein
LYWRTISLEEPGEDAVEPSEADVVKNHLTKEILLKGVVENHQGKVSEKPTHQKNQGKVQ